MLRSFSSDFFLLLTIALVSRSVRADEPWPRYIEPDASSGTSSAVVVGDVPLAHTPQILPLGKDGKIIAADLTMQVKQVLDSLHMSLLKVGSHREQIVKLNVYVTGPEHVADMRTVLAHAFKGPHRPAISFVVTRLPHSDALIAADAVAISTLDAGKVAVGTTDFQSTVMPAGSRIYVAGQAEKGSSLAAATRATLESLRKTLKHYGRTDADIVQLKAFLTPMSEAETVRKEIAEFYKSGTVPPVVLVEWKSSPETPIEIELVAWGGANRTGDAVEYLTPPGFTKSPIYSRVTRLNHSRTIFVAGLYASPGKFGADPNTPAEGEREVKEVFGSLERVLKLAGSDFRHLAKATYYVATDSASAKLNELRPKYYDPERPPSASKAMVTSVGRERLGLTLDMIAVPAFKDASEEYGPPEQGHGLSAADAAAGWIALFDGKSTFGWKDATVKDGVLLGGTTTSEFGNCELRGVLGTGGVMMIGGREVEGRAGEFTLKETLPNSGKPSPIRLGTGTSVKQLAVRPLKLESLFNGRDLAEWKPLHHPSLPEAKRPTWSIEEGALRAVGGPGCVEYQGAKFGDMVLQIDVRTRARHANGGVFFRAIPGDFMNGYEAQVFSRADDGDPARPSVWSTGGIDDRQNARRLVSRDGVYFRMTIIARGPRIATWVNGFQQTDFLDDRKLDANPRNGLRTEPGVIQLQAHDQETDVEFRNVAALGW